MRKWAGLAKGGWNGRPTVSRYLKVKRFLHELATAVQFNSWARNVGLDDARSVFWSEIPNSPSSEETRLWRDRQRAVRNSGRVTRHSETVWWARTARTKTLTISRLNAPRKAAAARARDGILFDGLAPMPPSDGIPIRFSRKHPRRAHAIYCSSRCKKATLKLLPLRGSALICRKQCLQVIRKVVCQRTQDDFTCFLLLL